MLFRSSPRSACYVVNGGSHVCYELCAWSVSLCVLGLASSVQRLFVMCLGVLGFVLCVKCVVCLLCFACGFVCVVCVVCVWHVWL